MESLEISENRYNIEVSGQIIPGWEVEEVKDNLAKLLKADSGKISQLLSGNRRIIKKNVDHQTAIKVKGALTNAGADCEMIALPNDNPATPPPVPAEEGPTESNRMPETVVQPSHEPVEIRTKSWWYVVALFVFLIPLIMGGFTIFNDVISYFSGGTQIMVPGETVVRAEEPGTYLIWYETPAFSERNISRYRLGEDFDIAMLDLATGEELDLYPPDYNGTETVGSVVRRAIAEVEFDTSGEYFAEVSGELPGSDGLLIRRANFAGLVKGIVTAGVLFFIGLIGGPLMALVVLVKRNAQKRQQRNESMGEEEENKWAMFAHIGTFSSMIIPLGNIITPIVIWQLKKHESSFVVDQAKESLNFQITLFIYYLISALLIFVVIGIFLIFGLVIYSIIIVIIAGVRANEGDQFRYPMTLRLFG